MLQPDISSGFDQLHPKLQRWIWQQGWQELRDIQELAIPALATGDNDLIIAAATASGKTEAAFLPIVSRLAGAEMKSGDGFGALYISPLRALINDQFSRLESLCTEMDIPVFKWHGDVAASVKARARKSPEGIVLITPESLESLLMRDGSQAKRYFARLSHIVIDELHAFMNAARGKQLQSLLHRIEKVAGKRIPRVGLSATLADMSLSASFLRPQDTSRVEILESKSGGQNLKLQLRGYIQSAAADKPIAEDEGTSADNKEQNEVKLELPAMSAICLHLFETLRGSRNLIFAGSRGLVEIVSAELTDLCERKAVPGEFLAHHGSLARAYREEAERRMKDDNLPASIVCTTTLELGIDVGNIASVAQIGPGHTVSGMRQRLGRSGRRPGQEAIFRVYTLEQQFRDNIHPTDALRPNTVQAIAMIELMLKRWNEPPDVKRLNLSTLMHQIMALIRQYGGMSAQALWNMLIESGIFYNVDKELFIRLLKRMGDAEVQLIEQSSDGTLLLGKEGERLTASFDFYAVFETPEEYRVILGGREIGRVPTTMLYEEGHLLILGGRYWKVLEMNTRRREILVEKSKGGKPPKFGGGAGPQSDVVVQEMRRLYTEIDIPRYLDKQAVDLIYEARKAFARYNLLTSQIIQWGDGFLLFPWLGSAGQRTLQLALIVQGLKANALSIAISVEQCTKEGLSIALAAIARDENVDAEFLAYQLPEKTIDKFDHYLDAGLQAKNYALANIDTSRLAATARTLLKNLSSEIVSEVPAVPAKYEAKAEPVSTSVEIVDVPNMLEPIPAKQEAISNVGKALSVIERGDSIVLILGRAGTGKTTLIRSMLENDGDNQVVLAPTGVAAVNVGGQTIHSFFRIPPRLHNFDEIQPRRGGAKLFKSIKRVIIDEISMVRADLMDAVDYAMKLNRNDDRPFGGVQMVLVGDFFQLPPVVRNEEEEMLEKMGYPTPYAFSAKCLQNNKVTSVELLKVHRQDNPEYIKLLGNIRAGTQLEETVNTFNAACLGPHKRQETPIVLAGTNAVADRYNQKGLKLLSGDFFTYEGIVTGEFKLEKDKLPVPDMLHLKVGARIMMVKNSKNWVNGSLGTIVRLEKDKVWVKIDGKKGEFEVEKASWENTRYEWDNGKNSIQANVVGSYSQIPVIPAWALTVHKAQGLTLENVRIDLESGAFASGQAYVALSRARSLEGLSFASPLRVADVIIDSRLHSVSSSL